LTGHLGSGNEGQFADGVGGEGSGGGMNVVVSRVIRLRANGPSDSRQAKVSFSGGENSSDNSVSSPRLKKRGEHAVRKKPGQKKAGDRSIPAGISPSSPETLHARVN
jgi:hypothetical protein